MCFLSFFLLNLLVTVTFCSLLPSVWKRGGAVRKDWKLCTVENLFLLVYIYKTSIHVLPGYESQWPKPWLPKHRPCALCFERWRAQGHHGYRERVGPSAGTRGAWEVPQEFRPGRFVGSEDFRGQHFQLIPFGQSKKRSGTRIGRLDICDWASIMVGRFSVMLPTRV
jgi:hypothetical protein